MNKKLEETFDLPQEESKADIAKEMNENSTSLKKEVKRETAKSILDVDDINDHDEKMDMYATSSFSYAQNIYELGMDIEPRHGAEMFNAAANMMKVALDAKNAKIDKRLKLYELELKKQKLELDKGRVAGFTQEYDSDMVVATREDLLKNRNRDE